jgi:inhibitor of cysteine peptidase
MLTKRWTVAILVLSILLTACSGAGEPATPSPTETGRPNEPTPGFIIGQAPVSHIEIRLMESFPVKVSVMVSGDLPDGCTQIDQINQRRDLDTNTFWVEITTRREAGVACTEALVPLGETISLDVYGLPAGTYTIDVNGVTDTFTLDVDNVPPKETPPLSPEGAKNTSRTAPVQDIEALSDAKILVRGNLPDGCTKLGRVEQTVEGQEIHITLYTRRSPDAMCTMALVPFEQIIPIDTSGLAAGEYTVDVNGVDVTLTLTIEPD